MTIVDSLKAKGSTGGNNIAEAIKNLPMGGSDTYVLNIYDIHDEEENTDILAIKPESILEIGTKRPSRVTCLQLYGETLDDMGDDLDNMGTYVYGGEHDYVYYTGIIAENTNYAITINVGISFSKIHGTSLEDYPELIICCGYVYTLENTTFGKYMYVMTRELD